MVFFLQNIQELWTPELQLIHFTIASLLKPFNIRHKGQYPPEMSYNIKISQGFVLH